MLQVTPTANPGPRASGHAPAPTFAVHDEGDGVLALHLTPYRTRDLLDPIGVLGADASMVEVSPRWGVLARRIDRRAIARLPEVELVDAPSGARDLPDSVLSDPHRALRTGRFAVAVSADGHAVIWSRDPAILAVFLGMFVDGAVARLAGTRDVPHAAPDALAPLLVAGEWHSLHLVQRGRFAELVIRTASALDEHRWVGVAGRAWRSGWAW